MRLGCAGCFVSILMVFLMIVVAASAFVALARALDEPDTVLPVPTEADGFRAQQKLYGLARVSRGASKEVVLTEAELNAFFARHLADAAELPLTGMAVRLVGQDVIEFVGRIPARHLLSELRLASLSSLLPARWTDRPAWLSLRARVGLEQGASREQRRYLRLDIERFALGRQRLPSALVRLLFSPATLGILRWRLPDTVESLRVEPGRLVIRTASSR